MKLFLDDIREPPSADWLLVKTADAAMRILKTGIVQELSLDHDLGDGVPTGYDVCNWIEEQVITNGFSPPKMMIHSANPVGRVRMEAAINSIERFVKRNDCEGSADVYS